METITGTVDYIQYQKPETGWTVAYIVKDDEENNDPTTVVGVMPGLVEGQQIKLSGEFAMHPRYGKQFKTVSYTVEQPATVDGILAYLQSGMIDYVGPEMARRITNQFGEKTFDIIEHHPNRLMEVSGIGEKRAISIKQSFVENKAIQDIVIFLQQHNIRPSLAMKIYQKYGVGAIDRIKADPYTLAKDIDRIGFKSADDIAMRIGFPKDSPMRIKAGIVYVLKSLRGHCYLKQTELLKETQKLLSVDEALILKQLNAMLSDEKKDIIKEGNAIYGAHLYKAEQDTAQGIVRLLNGEPAIIRFNALKLSAVEKMIDDLKLPFKLTKTQRDAVLTALMQKVSIITGGPGTGKSTIVKAIFDLMQGYQVLLVAPTGRAAKRLSEAVGVKGAGMTIHRAIGIGGINIFPQYNQEHPLPVDIVIIDEASMIDIQLASQLLNALSEKTHLVIVGDIDQLPSVGPGNVLKDLINSGAIPTTRLTTVFRQQEGSTIIENAHRINDGDAPVYDGAGTDGEFYLFPTEDASQASKYICDLVASKLPNKFGISPENIQVLSPIHAGEAGCKNLNAKLQATLNPQTSNKAEITIGKRVFRVGDRVMNIQNDYDRNVFNGDIGKITLIKKDKESGKTFVYINYDDIKEYELSAMENIVHAYACTIHKSQGSEFEAVIIPVLTAHYIMLVRNLLYTAVTRAKRLVVLVGSKKAISIAIANNKVTQRNTKLVERINLYKTTFNELKGD